MLLNFRQVFRIKLGNDPPETIPQLVIKRKPGATPIKDTQPRNAPDQRAFRSSTIQKFEVLGAVRTNPTRRASLALAVLKAGSEGCIFTVDLRPANLQTEPMASSMPNLESLFQTLQVNMIFAKIKLCHACWLLTLDLLYQEIFSMKPLSQVHGQSEAELLRSIA
jgi:hypothetical protein